MKNAILLISSFALILISCSEATMFDAIGSESLSNDSRTRASSDGLYDALGYGYDITGEYMGC